MQFAPEVQILILNAVIAAVAYFGIYPGLAHKTLNRIMLVDTVLTVLALTVAGALFWGTGVRFSLILFDTNWAVFSVLTLWLIETPLFLHFAKKYGIRFFDDPDA